MDSKQINIFWSEADRLVSLAAKYSQKVSLKENLLDEATAWKVQKPFYEYYGGNMSQLSRSIENGKKQFSYQVNTFNRSCRQCGVTEITKPDELLKLLLDPKRRAHYKKYIKKANDNLEVCSLQEIEKLYKGSSK